MAKAELLQKKLFDSLKDTELEHKLAIVGTDGTASMTGKYNGCIRGLEELLNKPLQWIVCLLHTNELSLRHVFGALDGSTSGPDTFAGPTGKKLHGPVSNWTTTRFKPLSVPSSIFPILPEQVVSDLSTDQFYACNICWALIHGNVDDDLAYLEVGPIVHSRWLTLGCRILLLLTLGCRILGGCRLENGGNPQKTNFRQVLDHLSGFKNYTFFDFQKKFFSLHPITQYQQDC